MSHPKVFNHFSQERSIGACSQGCQAHRTLYLQLFSNYAHCPTHECTDVTHLNASIQRCELLVHSSHTALHILCKLATALCLVVRRSLAMIFLYAVQAMVLRSDTQLKAYDDPLDAASLAGILTEDYGDHAHVT